jgi:hypothetical protein
MQRNAILVVFCLVFLLLPVWPPHVWWRWQEDSEIDYVERLLKLRNELSAERQAWTGAKTDAERIPDVGGDRGMEFFIVLGAIAAAIGSFWMGERTGAATASREILESFKVTLNLKSSSDAARTIDQSLTSQRSRREKSFSIGMALATVGVGEGAEMQSEMDAPAPDEAIVRMRRRDLEDVAWLADYGLRVWTAPRDNIVRSSERLEKERAQQMSSILDAFERKVAPPLSKTAEERDDRFSSHEDRMKRIWEYYG